MVLALGQVLQLAYGLLLGFCLGLVYDFYRFFLHLRKPGIIALLGLDLLFWLLMLSVTTALLLCYPGERVRLYLLCFQLTGFLVYHRLCSKGVFAFLCRSSSKSKQWLKNTQVKSRPLVKTVQQKVHKPFYLGGLGIYRSGVFVGKRKKAVCTACKQRLQNIKNKMRKNPPPPPPDAE